jgi:hypothetical protein
MLQRWPRVCISAGCSQDRLLRRGNFFSYDDIDPGRPRRGGKPRRGPGDAAGDGQAPPLQISGRKHHPRIAACDHLTSTILFIDTNGLLPSSGFASYL